VVRKILVGKNCRIGAWNRRNMEFSLSHNTFFSLGDLEIGSFYWLLKLHGVFRMCFLKSVAGMGGQKKGLALSAFQAKLPSSGVCQRHKPTAGGWQKGTNHEYAVRFHLRLQCRACHGHHKCLWYLSV
jgi:hypothetical protein